MTDGGDDHDDHNGGTATTAEEAAYRDHLVRAREAASRDYDKALLTLAAGALGISLVFIHNVAPHPKHTPWLAASWTLFAVSLLCVVASLLTSQYALLAAIKAVESEQPTDFEQADRSLATTATTRLNVAAGAAFILGVGALIVFAFLNVKGA